MSRTELCAFSGGATDGAKEQEGVAVEDFKEEEDEGTPAEEEDTRIGFASTTGLMWTEVLDRLLLSSTAGDEDFKLADRVCCGWLDVGTGGGTGGVVLPGEGGGVLSEASMFSRHMSSWFCFMGFRCLGVIEGSVCLAADSNISNFLAMALADLGRTGGGEAERVRDREGEGGATGDERGGGGETRRGGGA